ncbi:MAG: FISUMP domain-containing protein [Bacteroidetes bacterium]|nr:FISUMP domain-containing protein [Bacteroidota bacterium]
MKHALALLLAALATAAMAQHPEGYELLHEGDSTRFYKWNDGVACWEDAQNLAQSIGGHLATFHDEGEYNDLFNALSTSDYAWIGLVQEPGSTEPGGGWGWLTGEPLTFTDWNSNEPNQNAGMAEDVGAIWVTKGGWNDTPLCAGEGTLTFIVELTANEVLGCTDPSACNYNPAATADAGNCVSCEFIASFCGPGTTWDSETQTCIVANPADTNLDGCVQLNDLLDVLSAYGDCGAEEAPWACGDPLSYQGYDYATVQIGDQCWFAENLRAENYRNGDDIQQVEAPSVWQGATQGATCIYNADAALEQLHGRMYNQYACLDDRSICPQGWFVPNLTDFQELASLAGGASSALKANEIWQTQTGTNATGFAALPSGWRGGGSSNYMGLGVHTEFWTMDVDPGAGFVLRLKDTEEQLFFDDEPQTQGVSVRCLKNAE